MNVALSQLPKMKNYSLLSIVLLCCTVVFGQPTINASLPTLIPPSPTVSALMKFEEVPVSNYTGIPDVSIPLFSIPTLAKDIKMDVSLKYHPGAIAVDARSSDVGLGWSLFAGGTISRTVRGLPDEILEYPSPSSSPAGDPDGKIGIYQNGLTHDSNNYYYFVDNIANETQDFYQPYPSQQDQNIGNEFLWHTAYKNKFDTEHDLWQFNFMGHTGRFYIKKNANNQLEVVPLDDYRIKIINNYITTNHSYVPISFVVYDELGYRYFFDVIETSKNGGGINQVTTYNGVYQYSDSLYSDRLFNSSFHLSKIYDNSNNLIVQLVYDTSSSYKEGFTNHSHITNNLINTVGGIINLDPYYVCKDAPPVEITSFSNTVVDVKKLKSIDIIGTAKIDFNFLSGRADNNINNNQNTKFLSDIILKDLQGNQVKKYSLTQDYIEVPFFDTSVKRMFLSGIAVRGNSETAEGYYEFSYKQNNNYSRKVAKDYWGYFNLIDPCELTSNNRNACPEYCTTNVLQKIKYPTGGCTIFDFESNQYSYIGDEPVEDFDDNPDNWYDATSNYELPQGFTNTYTNYVINAAPVKRKIRVFVNIPESEENDVFRIDKRISQGSWQYIGQITCRHCCLNYVLDANTEYKFTRVFFSVNPIQLATLDIFFFEKINPQKLSLPGGGIRIKRIGYFKNDVPAGYYETGSTDNETPEKEKKYDYDFFLAENKSSGSLAFPIPVYVYGSHITAKVSLAAYSAFCAGTLNTYEVFFDNYTTYNNYSIIRTQGADVGYKEVAVFESGNGRTEYTYFSPIDFPEELPWGPPAPPFVPTKNFDYKRGLCINEKIYENQGNPLREVQNTYDFDEYIQHTGTRFKKPFGQCYTGSSTNINNNYQQYLGFLNQSDNSCVICSDVGGTRRHWLCGLPLDIDTPKIELFPIFEAYGWAKLLSKTTIDYLYDTNNNQKSVQTDETFIYNDINKQIKEHTVTTSKDDVLKTKYYYLQTVDSPVSQNNISTLEKIETYKGDSSYANWSLLSTNKINFANNWPANQFYLPQTIQTSKDNNILEDLVRYTAYDIYGHPMEVQQENGKIISYIWGYNKTQPIAKIENASNAQVTAALGVNLTTVDETHLSSINNLRTTLPQAMVTTFTYKPLIGVSTITDAKGYTTFYEYDNFGRLSAVKDSQGNLLSENEYHYRTQN